MTPRNQEKLATREQEKRLDRKANYYVRMAHRHGVKKAILFLLRVIDELS